MRSPMMRRQRFILKGLGFASLKPAYATGHVLHPNQWMLRTTHEVS